MTPPTRKTWAEQQAELDTATQQLGNAVRQDLINPVLKWAGRHRAATALLALLWVAAIVISELAAR